MEEKKEFREVPDGTYTCRFDVVENRLTKTNKPKLYMQFRIMEGTYAGCCMFVHQLTNTETGKKIADGFMAKAAKYGKGQGAGTFPVRKVSKPGNNPGVVFTSYYINDEPYNG